MDPELKQIEALQRLNLNVSVYRRLLKTNMPESGKQILRDEIEWIESVVIPEWTFYDV